MLLKLFMLFALTMMSNGEEDYYNSANENKECFKLCPETGIALHAHKTVELLSDEIHDRLRNKSSKKIGDYFSNDFKYVVFNQTEMSKENFVNYLEKLPKEQFVFIKCNEVYHTSNSLSCNAEVYGPSYGNVSAVRITFHRVEEKVLEFHKD
ncbi:hypothetical protein CAEBREN_01050 [Caenorhabditis brenneri]|uniref:NTF2-like domain-containing protein n=1 Tax=Caenorhabditis brenneri TaxID=135651 RepID=G0PDZ1_CAEBE|nr:hypothetical protein CAEBREN_01050 [Caenorhabditis brenneri]